MKINRPDIPKKYQPRGFLILHEDVDLIVGIKSAGFLTVAAAWDRENSIQSALTEYVRKGNARSTKEIFTVHRLDQATSGLLVFAKTERVQAYLKENWKSTTKTYLTVVQGRLKNKRGLIESYLAEDEDYMVRSTEDSLEGRLAKTEYEVLHETGLHSLVKVNLLTGRKNQIRVHMADLGHPVVGDSKYANAAAEKPSEEAQNARIEGRKDQKVFGVKGRGNERGAGKPFGRNHANGNGKPPIKVIREIALHAYALEFTHPHSKERYRFEAPPPENFRRLMPGYFSQLEEGEPARDEKSNKPAITKPFKS